MEPKNLTLINHPVNIRTMCEKKGHQVFVSIISQEEVRVALARYLVNYDTNAKDVITHACSVSTNNGFKLNL